MAFGLCCQLADHSQTDSVERSDVTRNPFEWLLGERMLYETPPPYFIVLASSVKTLKVRAIEFHRISVTVCSLK